MFIIRVFKSDVSIPNFVNLNTDADSWQIKFWMCIMKESIETFIYLV